MGQWNIGPTADAVIGREPYSLRCMMKTGDIMNKCSCEEYLLNQIIVTEFMNWTRVNAVKKVACWTRQSDLMSDCKRITLFP